MNQTNMKFEIFPKVIPADQEVWLTLTAPQPFRHDRYLLLAISLQMPRGATGRSAGVPLTLDPETGVLLARITAAGEQEHQLRLYDDTVAFEFNKPIATFTVYSLAPDLYALNPYKGDVHMHSRRSDGQDEPAHVAAACRRIGLDFMALTDHGQYAPSLEAQAAYRETAADLRIYRGEEVHPPENPIHIINFGGRFSVNDLFDGPEYRRQVAQIEADVGELPAGLDRYEYASALWSFDKIREAGGLGIFCHPYWFFMHDECRQGYYVNEALTTRLFDTQPFDALELLGGYHLHEAESNILQVARYHDERAKGRQIPVVGVSDAHGCETGSLFGWFYTIVFAASLELEDLISGIKGLLSVAVEALPGEVVRVYGPFRLVKYALFLLREVFPVHDALCREESAVMFDWIGENGSRQQQLAGDRLQAFRGRTAARLARDLDRHSS